MLIGFKPSHLRCEVKKRYMFKRYAKYEQFKEFSVYLISEHFQFVYIGAKIATDEDNLSPPPYINLETCKIQG